MSCNPFLDLGFSQEEATALHIRSQLAATLERYITRKGWSQAEAARTFKVPQPTISKIVNGNIEKLSIEFFDLCLVRLRRGIGNQRCFHLAGDHAVINYTARGCARA